MQKFDTLYKRTRTGAIQFWEVEVVPGDNPFITKRSGKLGTEKPLFHLEQITEGKQKRTASEQAFFMAESDWKKKKDEGYKTLADLGIIQTETGYKDDLAEYAEKHLSILLENALPEFNTDAQGEIKPMLAPNKAWEANGKTKYPVQGEIKSDGLRSFAVLTPDDTVIMSRSGKVYPNMTHLVEFLEQRIPRSTRTQKFILDGELYKHGLPLTKINEAVRGENNHTNTMQFWIYDLPTSPEVQKVRSQQIATLVKAFNSELFQHNAPVILESDEQVRMFHDECVRDGYEGAMIKDLEGTYQPGQRSPFWKKVKMFEDTEFKAISYKFGQRGVQDLMFVCECEAGEFEAVMNGSIEEKEALYAKIDSLIGKKLTVKHFGYTEYGIPFLPKGKAFREDGE